MPKFETWFFGHFLVNLSKKSWLLSKNEIKIVALLHAYSVKGFRPFYNYCIYTTDYDIGRCQNLRLDFWSFLGQFVKKSWFLPKMKKNSGLPYACSVKGCQPIHNYCIYATDYEMGCYLNLRLDFGSFLGQFVQKSWFLPK